MPDEGTIYADVRVRLDALTGDVKAVNTKLDQIAKKSEDTGKRSQKGLGKFFSFIRKSGVGSFLALSAVITGTIKVLKASEKAATDAQEIYGKFDVVFESIRQSADDTAKAFADSFDLAEVTAKKLLGTTGDLLTGFGATDEEALTLSESVNTLAADLASFSNIEGGVERASKALTSALLGEREQAKQLGIVIREVDIQQKLLEKGQQDLTGEALSLAKAEATLEIAYEQSQKAIGDYERTQESAANSTKRASEANKELLAALGSSISEGLIPLKNAWTNVANAIAETINQERALKEAQRAGEEGVITARQQLLILEDNLERQLRLGNLKLEQIDFEKTIRLESKRRAVEEIKFTLDEIEAKKKQIEQEDKIEGDRAKAADKEEKRINKIADAREKAFIENKTREEDLTNFLADQERERLIDRTVALDDAREALLKLYNEGKISIQEYGSGLDDVATKEKEVAEKRQENIATAFSLQQDFFNALIQLSQANLQNQLADIDAATQARLEAAGVAEQTEIERLEEELQAAKDAGDAETANQLEQEILRTQILEEGEKKKAQAQFEASTLQWKLQLANAISSAAQAILTTASSVPFPFNIPLTAAQAGINAVQISAINAAKPKAPTFQDGGIVPGNSFTGDKVGARVNSGEMILNQDQQQELFNIAKGVGGGTGGGTVTIQIYKNGRKEAEEVVNYINNGNIRVKL